MKKIILLILLSISVLNVGAEVMLNVNDLVSNYASNLTDKHNEINDVSNIYRIAPSQFSDTISANKSICWQPNYQFLGYTFELPNLSPEKDSFVYVLEMRDIMTCMVNQMFLTVHYPSTSVENVTICPGDIYMWHNEPFEQEGSYTMTLEDVNGCDSVATLNLFVSSEIINELEVVACEEYIWKNNQVLTESGIYYDTLVSRFGCDSIDVLRLIISHSDTLYTSEVVCDSYIWHGEEYTTSGQYQYTVSSISGCDSIEILDLVVNQSPYLEYTDTMMGYEPYKWYGMTISEGGDYTLRLAGQEGCDTIMVLHLVDNPVAVENIYPSTQCAGDGALLLELQTSGYMDKLLLSFSTDAEMQGAEDTTMYLPLNDVQVLPYELMAGVYDLYISGYFRDYVVLEDTIQVVLQYPSTVFEQVDNETLAVLTKAYNGGYDFELFQWYQNGTPLLGETKSYLRTPLVFGAEYAVLLTDSRGVELLSCSQLVKNMADVMIYPTVMNQGEAFVCHTTEKATLVIYGPSGHRIYYKDINKGDTSVAIPMSPGVYLVMVVVGDDSPYIQKVIVR